MSEHDPTAEPDWHTSAYPELRSGPPWVMQEMMASEPALAPAILGVRDPAVADAAAAIGDAARTGQAVTVCGCGTSEHAALGIAALLDAALPAGARPLVHARPAFSVALDPLPGVCLAVSHDGETRATRLAVEAARRAGARTVAVTARADGAVARAADHALVTPVADRSWCHTVAYTSALLAGAAVAARLGLAGVDAAAAEGLLRDGLAVSGADRVADALKDRRVVLCAGAGADHATARELALKIAEGAQLPAVALELETVLHGQLAAHDAADGLVLIATAEHDERDRVTRRVGHVAGAAAAIGLPVAAVLSPAHADRLPGALTPAGRILTPARTGALGPTLTALLAGATAAQTLALALAHARGTNPDLLRREHRPYRDAAAVGKASGDW